MEKGRATFNEGSMWTIGRDSKVNFWWENWTGKGALRYMIQGPLTQGADKWKVGDILSDLCWDWDRIPFEIPPQVKSIIQTTPIPFTSRDQDKLAWSGNPRGIFDLRSAYSITTKEVFAPPFNYAWIWKLQTLPRIKTFLWLCTHNSIGVKVCLAKRGVVVDELCLICQREPESIIHAIRDCAWVKAVWVQLGVSISNQAFWMSNLQEWISLNGKTNSSSDRELWGLREGLLLCCNLNIDSLVVELDAQAVVEIFKNATYVNNVISPLLDDCRRLTARFHRIRFNHCYRQANRCADLLARMGAIQDVDFISFSSPAMDICNAFEDDCDGVLFNRMCPVLDVIV
ncbi:hypothetical protein SO802_011370 [Lithocarpus litseifolius]|uniref:RNase H type-1 domain-containing protein n=1 Tax=Lithocarpus litseifolius TaxID=425828 RepID=A0AAW2D0G9_9ROSI